MGLSSRPVFDFIKLNEVIEFFVEAFEAWRSKINLNKFILCGHSFGGYISA